jgi:hypothetical protein
MRRIGHGQLEKQDVVERRLAGEKVTPGHRDWPVGCVVGVLLAVLVLIFVLTLALKAASNGPSWEPGLPLPPVSGVNLIGATWVNTA